MTRQDPVRLIADLFASAGAADYLGEPVTQAEHMLQAATLAELAGAEPHLVAAALLHDVGHLELPSAGQRVTGRELMSGTDNWHSEVGATWLGQWFGPEVTEPVRLHVAAKRYLCAIEPGYAGSLSAASVFTLRVQGGPMSQAEARDFAASRYAQAACQVRRWDDAAKDPRAPTPRFDHFRPLLAGLVKER